MDEAVSGAYGLPSSLDLIIFRSSGIRMAAYAGQVESIVNSDENQGGKIVSVLQDKKPCLDGPASVPSFTILCKGGAESCGMGADGIDAIISTPLNNIMPVPEFLLNFRKLHLYWGAIFYENNIVLLVDISMLKEFKPLEFADNA